MKTEPHNTSFHPSKLVIRGESHTIFKQKPKIRIIHIVAPEIIKTDVGNFREIVQRLTGKPLEESGATKKGKNVPATLQKKRTQSADSTQKESEDPNTFLSFLGDVQGYMHGMNEFRPLLPFRSSQVNTFGEMLPYRS